MNFSGRVQGVFRAVQHGMIWVKGWGTAEPEQYKWKDLQATREAKWALFLSLETS